MRLENISKNTKIVSSDDRTGGNMANEKQKCPICGTKLKMIDGRMTCSKCGYYLREQADTTAAQNNTAGMQMRPQAAPTTQTGSTKKSGGGTTVAIVSVTLGLVACAVAVASVIFVRQLTARRLNSLPDNQSVQAEKILGDSSADLENSEDEESTEGRSPARSALYLPRSAFFQELAEVIFDKPCSSITQEELARVTALELNLDDHTIYYELDYEDGIPLTFSDDSGISLSDLNFFPGLEWVSLVGGSFDTGNLGSLNNLYGVYSENSLEELANIIPHPENITSLGAGDNFFLKNSLDDVLAFPNLEYLALDNCRYLEDISALTEMYSLKGLYLIDCNDLMDYSPLMSLPNLEELSIQSTQLKSIDFVSAMPNLTYLGIEDSQVTNIDALSNCPDLTTLYLMENYAIENYLSIGDLTQLTTLTIFKDTDSPIPSLENLTALEQASFGRLWEGELSLVTAAPNISQLYLERCYDDRLELLTSLPLTHLGLVDCSLDDYSSLTSLSSLPLVQLDMSDSYVFGNMEMVFGIPTLQYLYLDEVTGVIDFDRVPDNESLLTLSMSGFTVKTEAYFGSDEPLSNHYDLFEHFPNVEELYLADTGIDSIAFVEQMPNLVYLDITQNNVTSLKPLEALPYFQRVDCGYNTILEPLPDDSDVYVNIDSEYYPY